jgi:hypothetical protein
LIIPWRDGASSTLTSLQALSRDDYLRGKRGSKQCLFCLHSIFLHVQMSQNEPLVSSSYFISLPIPTNKRSIHHVLVTLVGLPSSLNQGNCPPHSSKLRTINHRRAYSLPSMQQRKPLTWDVLNHLSSIKGLVPSLDHITRINPSPRIPSIPLPVHTTPPPPPPARSPQSPLTPTLLFFSRYPSLHGPSLHFLEHSPHPSPTQLASSISPLPIKRAEGRREDYSHGGSQGRWRGFPVHALGVRGAGVPTLWFS